LCTCAAWMAGQGVSASKLNPSEKRAMELNPAVVLVSVKYQVNGRFKVGGETVPLGPSPSEARGAVPSSLESCCPPTGELFPR
jgi:hypothetical protein